MIPPSDAAEVWFARASEWDGDPERWESAVEAYERVLAIDPGYAAAWNNLGLLQHRMGHYERARTCYRAGARRRPDVPAGRVQPGIALRGPRRPRRGGRLVPPGARDRPRLRRRPLQPGRRARQAGAQRQRRRSTGGATSSWTSGAPGPRSPARTWRPPRPKARARRRRRGDARDEGAAGGRRAAASTRSPGRSRRAPSSPSSSRRPAIPASRATPAACPCGTTRSTSSSRLARDERIDLTVVGPEVPLALGLADRLRAAGGAVFGPGAAAARIESSKVFAKDLMARHRIPTASFRTFTEAAPARAFCRELGAPLVVKADGLAAGKGAIVCRTLEEADRALALCLEERAFGASGRTVVVEEFMEGEEASFFVDRRRPIGPAARRRPGPQDRLRRRPGPEHRRHGRVLAGAGRRPATPPSGSWREIVRPVLAAMATEGAPYAGFLFVGLMLGAEGPRVVEFNCRFGDPECQAIMPRLDQDLLPCSPRWRTGNGLPAALAVEPGRVGLRGHRLGRLSRPPIATGHPHRGPGRAGRAFPAPTSSTRARRIKDGRLVTAGGRVLGVQALGKPTSRARSSAPTRRRERVRFEGAHYRRDIGPRPRPHGMSRARGSRPSSRARSWWTRHGPTRARSPRPHPCSAAAGSWPFPPRASTASGRRRWRLTRWRVSSRSRAGPTSSRSWCSWARRRTRSRSAPRSPTARAS